MSADCCDSSLVLRAKSGEQGAFNTLVRKYRHRVLQLSMRYTRNRADAEDAVQNTFLKAYWGLQRFRGDAAFSSWLHRIAVNSAKTVSMLRARDASIFTSDMQNDNYVNEHSSARNELDTPEKLALTEEICRVVNAAIEGLCEEQRTAVMLREFQGFSYSQVASAMACPVGTVRSRVYRAREAIDNQVRHVFDHGLGRAARNRSPRPIAAPA
jgi:RNA polymerase sigma-70 factor (ECF subfamily)